MPTAAKLIAALFFALLGWWAGVTYNAHLPDNVSLPRLPLGMLGLGLFLGWRSMGAAAGQGYRESMGYGLRTSVLIAVLAMFITAFLIMLRKSMSQMYRADPVAAVLDVPNLMYDYGQHMLTQDVLMVLLLGALVGGVISEYAARRWS